MLKVILVDDEKDILHGLAKIIDWRGYGYEIVGLAENGSEALALSKVSRPHLIISDIRMPEMDGLELAKELHELDPSVVFIILSGFNDFAYAKEALKYGVWTYLLKPLDISELEKELEHIRHHIVHSISAKEQRLIQLRRYHLFRLTHIEVTPEESGQLAIECKLEFPKSFLNVILATHDNKVKNVDLLDNFSILLNKDHVGYVYEEYSRLVIILNTDNTDEVAAFVNELIYRTKDISLAVGSSVVSLGELHDSYKQALWVQEWKGFEEQVIYYDDLMKHHQERMVDSFTYDVLAFIRAHYSEALTLKKLANRFFVNPAYLGQLINKRTGVKFNEYLHRVRISKAKELLSDSEISIRVISECVGYKNIDHFYKSFKAIVGMNPGEYREGLK